MEKIQYFKNHEEKEVNKIISKTIYEFIILSFLYLIIKIYWKQTERTVL